MEQNDVLVLGREAIELADPREPWKTETFDSRQNARAALRIRPYQKSDRATIEHLCCETGFLGERVDRLFQDRELFAELFTRPYLDHEPEWVFVAEEGTQVVGYLLGSVRPDFDMILMQCGLRTTAKMLMRLAQGRYANHPRSRRFIRWLLTAAFWEQPKHPAHAAHLHIQVDEARRGRQLGPQLLQHFENRLREAGVRKYYGSFYSYPRRRRELAGARYGFTVFDRRRTTLFEPEIRDPVEVVCACKSL
jgi:ribosomal protein S18 acetylase RimI-like enzyme